MNSKWILACIVLILGAGAGYYFFKADTVSEDARPTVTTPESEVPQEAARPEGAIAPEQIAEINKLIESARQKDQSTFTKITEWLNSKSNYKVEAALVAVSFYPDQVSLSALYKALPGFTEVQKIRMVEVIMDQPTPERRQWIQDLAKSGNSGMNTIAGFFATNSFQGLEKKVESLSPQTQTKLVNLIGRDNPNDVHLQNWLLKVADSNTDEILKSAAIAQLARSHNKAFAGKVKSFAKNQTPSVRAAALRAIPAVCPADRWTILSEAARTETNPQVMVHFVNVLGDLGGAKAQELLGQVKKREPSLVKQLDPQIAKIQKDLAVAKSCL